ncbi:hypothetical protein F3Y22_tig00110895pilonHSYRG00096 [Hibiscus syriacus]|uniref:Uncharacterized protein n=1 Tax=Hibiscus syriacus TaxID=106335 RepID=A0A6A2ZFI5_HIBSY|nr:MAP7 domain-containing protein 1-like [Hibiscus syriacus]KAE8690336.1 hypothetical protein F3Y22_tig00110895pilonHSYRG00096 [Hibiscus syriacus]
MEQSCDTEEEIMVANIMLVLSQSEPRRRFDFTWGSRGKRSTRSKSRLAAASLPTPKPSPPPQPKSPSPPSKVVGPAYATVGPLEKALLTSSPATPLSFPPSESDEKPPAPPKRKPHVNNFKKKKEQLLEIIEDFTRQNELLKKEIVNKKRIYDQQKSENMELKAKKLKISMEAGNTNRRENLHQQPLMMEMDKNPEHPIGGMICWVTSNIGGISKLNDNVGPLGVIDLNVSPEEGFGSSISFDLETATKARAAEARLKRRQICKSKHSNSACKARHPS